MASPFWIAESLKDKEFSSMYTLGKELGKGPTAIVHKCEQRGTGAWAAKIIPKSQIKRKIRNVEIGALLRLRHPNVIRLREVFETEQRVYLVCQLETGGDLLDRVVTHGTYTEQDVSRCIRSILMGLAYLHENDVIHGNIKPENLLYDSSPEDSALKIADFGVSQIIGPEVRKHAVSHMPGYVAPEILQGHCGGREMDIWSVGVIAYLLLSGREPFHCDSAPDTYKQIIKGEYSLDTPEWDDVTVNGKDLVRRLLVLEPGSRLTAQTALQHAWVRGLGAGEADLTETQGRLKQLNLQRRAQRVTVDFCLSPSELPAAEELPAEVEEQPEVQQLEPEPETKPAALEPQGMVFKVGGEE